MFLNKGRAMISIVEYGTVKGKYIDINNLVKMDRYKIVKDGGKEEMSLSNDELVDLYLILKTLYDTKQFLIR